MLQRGTGRPPVLSRLPCSTSWTPFGIQTGDDECGCGPRRCHSARAPVPGPGQDAEMIDRCDEIREELIGFAEGETPPARHRQVAAHLVGCAACAREAERLAEVLSRTRALPTPEMPEAFWADFRAAVRQRVAAEAPPRAPFFRRVGAWRDRLAWLRPVPALGAAVAAGVLLAFGLARIPRVPPSPPPAESVVVGDSLAIAQHLDILEHLDELEHLDLLEHLTLLRAPELGRLPARS